MELLLKRDDIWPCFVCGKEEIIAGSGVYYVQAIIEHFSGEHGLSIEDYLALKGIYSLKCECGCNGRAGFYRKGSRICSKRWKTGHVRRDTNSSFNKACSKMSKDRMGENNPMYGATPWNKGLQKEDLPPSMIGFFDRKKGSTLEDFYGATRAKEIKLKLSKAALRREVHGHTGKRHSKETRKKLSQHTINLHKAGRYTHTKSKIHSLFESFLDSEAINYESEKQVGPFLIDIFIEPDICIEIQGDFFHCNPVFYPNGPSCKIQKRNAERDLRKLSFLRGRGFKVVEVWENEINEGKYEEKLFLIKSLLNKKDRDKTN